ncbi:hypothetical protein Pcinc_025518 [Petrolisthes cinctipes]|uniref:G-protein coupled receptors family 2 profile 2 domain-containing protein n=1 Tax=Petrolisthes cinctipes TaxID=88211 RepID=A0AAE1KBH4_PETCI|nr:hypothetical protein Pcinc_025518 [Petrolisthes cinctipes]
MFPRHIPRDKKWPHQVDLHNLRFTIAVLVLLVTFGGALATTTDASTSTSTYQHGTTDTVDSSSSSFSKSSGNSTQKDTGTEVYITQDPVVLTTEPPQPRFSIKDLFINTTLRKCRCPRDEVWNGSQCISKPAIVPVFEHLTGQPYLLNTTDFTKAIVRIPNCPEDHALIPIDFTHNSHFFLMNNESLRWQNDEIHDDYCLENVLQDDGHVLMEAHVCLYLSVPQCCPPGHLLGSDGHCLLHEVHHSFAPPVDVATKQVHWQGVPEEVQTITCDGVAEVTQINLNEGNILHYSNKFPHAPLAWMHSDGLPGKLHLDTDYCVGLKRDDESGETKYVAKVCFVDPKVEHQLMCRGATCVRKCCEENQLLDGKTCVSATHEDEIWMPIFYDPSNSSNVVVPPDDLKVVHGWPLCRDFHFMDPTVRESDKVYLLENGYLDDFLGNFNLPPTDYCVDLALDPQGISPHPSLISLVCPSDDNNACQWAQTLKVVLSGISFLFLAATLVIYLGVPELRDRSNGRCLISMISAMMSTYICLTVLNEVPGKSDSQCIITAFFGHVSVLATFFWLNVMCFDMWSTLRSSQQQHHSMKVFCLYSLYAWGVPLLVGLLAVVLDILELPGVIRPLYLEHSCWFWRDTEFWAFQGGIILFLVVVNLFFFIHVAIILARKLKQRKRMFETTSSSHSNKSTNAKKQAWLFVKLFIVMGVLWIAETLSIISHRKTCSYWLLSDIINSLQGVFIFLVAVCNKDNIKKIRTSWEPRLQSVRRTITLRDTITTNTSMGKKRMTDLSVAASEDSRKTSVTSLPRKLSAVSQVLFMTGNKNKSLGSEMNEVRHGDRSPSPRKGSSVSNYEITQMAEIKE